MRNASITNDEAFLIGYAGDRLIAFVEEAEDGDVEDAIAVIEDAMKDLQHVLNGLREKAE